MRYLLTVVLLILLPLQSIWAVAATYDGHERSGHEQYFFGHHDGHHHGPSLEAPDDGSTATLDADSSHSHVQWAAALLSVRTLPAPAAALPSTPCTQAAWRGPALSPPERPQWAGHA